MRLESWRPPQSAGQQPRRVSWDTALRVNLSTVSTQILKSAASAILGRTWAVHGGRGMTTQGARKGY